MAASASLGYSFQDVAHVDALDGFVATASAEHTVVLLRLSDDRRIAAVSVMAGESGAAGTADGVGSVAHFDEPWGVAVCDGLLYVSDYGNHVVRTVSLSATEATVTTLAGSAGIVGTTDGAGASARFSGPKGVVCAPGGGVYVASDTTVRHVAASGSVTTIAGAPGTAGSVDGVGTVARLMAPVSLALSPSGDVLYIGDGLDTAPVSVRAMATNGYAVSTLVGGGALHQDGAGAAVGFARALVAMDVGPSGLLWVVDGCADGSLVRQVNVSTRATTTLAGSAVAAGCAAAPAAPLPAAPRATVDGTGSQAQLQSGGGLVVATEVCGAMVSAAGVSHVTLSSSCAVDAATSLPGSLSVAADSGVVVVASALHVGGAMIVGERAVLEVTGSVSVSGSLVVAANATLTVHAATASFEVSGDVAMGGDAVLHVRLASDTVHPLTTQRGLSLGGASPCYLLLTVEPAYVWPVGATATVAMYGSAGVTGSFARVFVVRLRVATARRLRAASVSSAEATAPAAAVACEAGTGKPGELQGQGSCVATGMPGVNGDDDDEMGLIVALAVTSVSLLAVLVVACVMISRRVSSDAMVAASIRNGRSLSSDYSTTESYASTCARNDSVMRAPSLYGTHTAGSFTLSDDDGSDNTDDGSRDRESSSTRNLYGILRGSKHRRRS